MYPEMELNKFAGGKITAGEDRRDGSKLQYSWPKSVRDYKTFPRKKRNRHPRLPAIDVESESQKVGIMQNTLKTKQDYKTPKLSSRKRSNYQLLFSPRDDSPIGRTYNQIVRLNNIPPILAKRDRHTSEKNKLLSKTTNSASNEDKVIPDHNQHIKMKQDNVEHHTNDHKTAPITLINVGDKDIVYTDTLHRKSAENTMCGEYCLGALMGTLTNDKRQGLTRPKDEIIQQAKDFIEQYYKSINGDNNTLHTRLKEIMDSIENKGTYDLTYDELAFGTKLAWRNAPRCIGRIQWSNLHLFDSRTETTAKGMFDAICRHLKYTTNKGKIRPTITIFRQRTDEGHDFRIWNSQLVSYAGYKHTDGSIIGDPINVDFTSFCMEMGWKGGYGMFDVLPLILQANGKEPEMFELPKELIMEANITHPKFPGLAKLGLKWYCVPAVSNMMFDCGGMEFTACTFTGWYMSTEVAIRDLCDAHRYDMLEKIALNIGLDTKTNASLWKDRAAVEINTAVLHSFQTKGVTIVDHHTASDSFMTFLHNEYKQRSGCPADWVWIVPPMSGSLMPVFHQEMVLFKLKPSYEYQSNVLQHYIDRRGKETKRSKAFFRTAVRVVIFSNVLIRKVLGKRTKCTILYATETGKSEKFANSLHEIFKHNFNARVMNMEKYKVEELPQESLMLFVTSTFGNGDPPESGKSFAHSISQIKNFNGIKMAVNRFDNTERLSRTTNGYVNNNVFQNVKFSVFGLGSRAYPNFCAFSRFIDRNLTSLGASKLLEMGEGDELCGQDESFRTWAKKVFQIAARNFKIKNIKLSQNPSDFFEQTEMIWNPEKFRLVPALPEECLPHSSGLAKLYNKTVHTCFLKKKIQLEQTKSSRQTILLTLDLGDRAKEVRYRPGDHVLVFTKNPGQIVRDIISHVHKPPPKDQLVKLECINDSLSVYNNDDNDVTASYTSSGRLLPGTFDDFLTRNLDITTPPSQDFLKKLSTLARLEVERNTIERLANDMESYDEWKRNIMPTIADVVKTFPSLVVSPTFLLTQLPVLQPRYYSISSSLEAVLGEVHITAEVLQYRTPDGNKHLGVCTNWLNSLNTTDEIHCSLKSAPLFHMPKDSTLPILMVGPGTGIAPFRSFWMQRTIDKSKYLPPQSGNRRGWGDMFLYFGCRSSTLDNLYKEEIEECERNGVITKYFFAFSREPGIEKTYVQDLLSENGKEVYKQIYHDKGHFYICGNIQMASDVKETLCNIMETWGKMSSVDASAYIDRLKNMQTDQSVPDIDRVSTVEVGHGLYETFIFDVEGCDDNMDKLFL